MQERNDAGGQDYSVTGQPPEYAPPPSQQWYRVDPPARRRAGGRRTVLVGGGCLLLGLIIGYSAGHSSTTTTPDAASPIVTNAATSGPTSISQAPAVAATSKPTTVAPKAAPAKVGDSITLAGHDGEKIAVTVVKVVDPAKPGSQDLTPDAGKRFVAVQLRFVNAGTVAYSDSVDNGATLVDGDGQSFSAEPFTTAAGPGFANGEVTIAPGATGLGWITFEVPAASKSASIQVGLDSGFSQKGQWQLR